MTELSRPVRFVYFDLDDTLLDHHHAELHALRDLHADEDSPFGQHTFDDVHAAYRTINPVIWKEYAAGSLTKKQAKVGRFSRLLDTLDIGGHGRDADLADRYLQHYANHWKPLPGAFEAFSRIADLLPVGIMTNGFTEIQTAKLAQFPDLSARSSAVVISEEVGVLKPHPALFEEAARRVDTPPEHILYVGDSLHSDVEGGIAAGWQVAWLSREEHDHADVHVFSDWDRLTELVGA